MSKPVTPDKLIEDLQVVVHDAEALLKATAAQTGEKIQEARARTEESGPTSSSPAHSSQVSAKTPCRPVTIGPVTRRTQSRHGGVMGYSGTSTPV